ncbi:MAG: hypothetical protein EPN40_00395, partial [Rhodanobacteraceae bacterium]
MGRAALVLCLGLLAVSGVSATAQPQAQVTVAGDAGSTTPIRHWEVQTSAKAQEGGQAISRPGYDADGWLPVSGEATVMAGLLENGWYAHVFHGLELQRAGRHHFQVPWWYRTRFRLAEGNDG